MTQCFLCLRSIFWATRSRYGYRNSKAETATLPSDGFFELLKLIYTSHATGSTACRSVPFSSPIITPLRDLSSAAKQPQPLYILQNHAHVRKTRTNCEQMSVLRAFASQSFPIFSQRICAATHIHASKMPNITYKARFFVFYAPPDAEPERS